MRLVSTTTILLALVLLGSCAGSPGGGGSTAETGSSSTSSSSSSPTISTPGPDAVNSSSSGLNLAGPRKFKEVSVKVCPHNDNSKNDSNCQYEIINVGCKGINEIVQSSDYVDLMLSASRMNSDQETKVSADGFSFVDESRTWTKDGEEPKAQSEVFQSQFQSECSSESDVVQTTDLQSPSELVSGDVTSTAVELKWKDNSKNEDLFSIERMVQGKKEWVLAGIVGKDITKFTDRGVSPLTSYVYRVTAFSKLSKSKPSDELEVKTLRKLDALNQYIFVTSKTLSGKIGGSTGADKFCQDAARNGSLGGKWLGLGITDQQEGFPRNFAIGSRVLNLLDQSVTGQSSSIFYGPFENTIATDEFGMKVTDRSMWGQFGFGSPIHFDRYLNCNRYTTDSKDLSSYGGINSALDGKRWFANPKSCAEQGSLYCIREIELNSLAFRLTTGTSPGEVQLEITLPKNRAALGTVALAEIPGSVPPSRGEISNGSTIRNIDLRKIDPNLKTLVVRHIAPEPNKMYAYSASVYSGGAFEWRTIGAVLSKEGEILAKHRFFVSSRPYNGNLGGVQGADAQCRQMGGAQNYKAVLSTSTQDAKDRIAITGPIANNAGQIIAGNAEQFWNNIMRGPIQTENGLEFGRYDARVVLTGTREGGVRANYNCNDWTSGSSESRFRNGLVGSAEMPGDIYYNFFLEWAQQDPRCNGYDSGRQPYRIYCIEQ